MPGISFNLFCNITPPQETKEVTPQKINDEHPAANWYKDHIIVILELCVLTVFLMVVLIFTVGCVIENIKTPTITVMDFIRHIHENWKGAFFVLFILLYRPFMMKFEQLKKIAFDKKVFIEFLKGKK